MCIRIATPRRFNTHSHHKILWIIDGILGEHNYSLVWCENFMSTRNDMSRDMRKPTMWFLTRSDTNQAVQLLEMARGLKFCI